MALDSQQQQVLNAFNKAIRHESASQKVAKALIESGLVESHLTNPAGGDRDSEGPLQQRPSSGYTHARDPYLAAVDFIRRATPVASQYGTAGALAQAVQRSAFPARYQQQSSQAQQLLRGSGAVSAPGGGGLVTSSTPGVDRSADRLAALRDYLVNSSGSDHTGAGLINTLQAMKAMQDTPATQGSPGASQGLSGVSTGTLAFRSIDARLKAINAAHLPYKWGGGHAGKVTGAPVPVDCSGAVSEALGIDPRVASQFKAWGKGGKDPTGQLTIWAKDTHVILERNGHFWGTSASNPGGGAGWIPRAAISPQYLKGFTARHA